MKAVYKTKLPKINKLLMMNSVVPTYLYPPKYVYTLVLYEFNDIISLRISHFIFQ